MKYLIIYIILAAVSSCHSNELSLKVGRITAANSSKGSVYFYRIVNGLSTDAYFLSMKNDICKGLNKNEDLYFRALDPLIYYNIETDTLFIYTNSPIIQPVDFGYIVERKPIPVLEEGRYEKMYRDKIIQKVIIDSIYIPDCKVSY